jgi:hypothetical protein
MPNLTRLPDPLPHPDCGAGAPDGPMCQAPSAVTITTCLAADYAVIVWRCAEHADDGITEAARLADHAMIMVEPVGEAEGPAAPVAPFPCQRRAGTRRPRSRRPRPPG